MPQPIYSFEKLIVDKKGHKILFIKKFEMHRGATYVVDGCMGSGKTTLIDIIGRNKRITSGNCEYEKKKLSSYSTRLYNDQIALVPQDFNIPFGTVRRFIRKTLKKYSHLLDIDKRIEDISRKMEIEDIIDCKMRHLSNGQVRWVVLAANIAADTKVLLIDEIEQHLSRKKINQLVKLLYRKSNYDGVTIIITTQNKDLFSQRLGSVIITLESGRIMRVRSSSKRKKYNNKK